MKKVISVFVVALTIGGTINAQNSLYYKAQGLMQENKIQEAKEVITPALTSGKTKKLSLAYNMAGDIQARILQGEILKAAKNLPLDTALFVSSLNKAYNYYTKSQEVDMTPDKKGRIKPKCGDKNKKKIKELAGDFLYAAQFQYKNHDFDGAYDSYMKYLSYPSNLVFSKSEKDSIETKYKSEFSKVAYYAAMTAYGAKKWDKVLVSAELALKDTSNLKDLYIMKLTSLLNKKDTTAWVEASKEAIRRVKNSDATIQNLLYYYSSKGKIDEALKMANEFVAQAPKNKMSWYTRGCVYLNIKKDFKKSREDFDKVLAIDSLMPEALVNKGVSYINEVVANRDKFTTSVYDKNYKADREKVLSYYRKALPYFEKYRVLCPEKSHVWAANLRNIYYNLGNKEKEQEMDDIVKSGD